MVAIHPKGAVKDEVVTYFFLIKHTEKGTVQSAAQKNASFAGTGMRKVSRRGWGVGKGCGVAGCGGSNGAGIVSRDAFPNESSR